MALIVGLGAASTAKATVLASLLIIGIADNLSDSLSIQIYQESEQMAQRQAFGATVANYAARFAITGSFVVLLLIQGSVLPKTSLHSRYKASKTCRLIDINVLEPIQEVVEYRESDVIL